MVIVLNLDDFNFALGGYMEKLKILCLVGGIASNSLNKKLYQLMLEFAPEDFNLSTFDISRLPFFSQDLENDPPDSVVGWKDRIREADAVLFITPEYNRSIPGVLKNAIDWGSRPYGQNLWDKKPAAVMGASIGATGTFGAQHHLRQTLAYLNMAIMGQPEFYLDASRFLDKEGRPVDGKTTELIHQYWESFSNWIERVSQQAPRTMKPKSLEDSPTAH